MQCIKRWTLQQILFKEMNENMHENKIDYVIFVQRKSSCLYRTLEVMSENKAEKVTI